MLKVCKQISMTIKPPAKHLPVSPFQCKPVRDNRFVILHVNFKSEEELLIAFDGRSYNYRSKFEAACVPRADGPDCANLRLFPEDKQNMSVAANKQLLFDVLGDSVLQGVIMVMKIQGDLPDEDTVAHEVSEELKALPNVYLDAF